MSESSTSVPVEDLPDAGVTPATAASSTAVARLAVLVLVMAVITAFVLALTKEKLQFLYKDELHLSPSEVGSLNILLGLPAYVQPFLGAWTDSTRLFGYHRRSYFMLGALVNAAGWGCLGLLSDYAYAATAGILLIRLSGAALLNVVLYATMAGIGNRSGAFGRLLSLSRFVPLIISAVIGARLGGYVAGHWSYGHVFLTAALLVLFGVPLALLIDEEHSGHAARPQESVEEHATRLAARQAQRAETIAALRDTARSPGLWAITVYVFYLILTPGLNNTRIYYETDVLHFSKQLIGNLDGWSAFGALTALVVFGLLSRRLSMGSLVWTAWLMDCISYPVMICFRDPFSARLVMAADGFIGIIYALCLYTLAARACPKRLEGTVFGMVLAAIALGGSFSEKLGGFLYESLGPRHGYTVAHGWYASLWVGFGFTVAAVLLIPFLPEWARSQERLQAAE